MLFLVFQLGADRFAVDTATVAEVLPLMAITPIQYAPPGISGIINYHGTPVPVVDLSQLTVGRPAAQRLNTRIVLVHYTDRQNVSRLLGLIAEKASETIRRDPSEFAASGVNNPQMPHLGKVASDARGLMQWIEVGTLLPASVRDALFNETVTV